MCPYLNEEGLLFCFGVSTSRAPLPWPPKIFLRVSGQKLQIPQPGSALPLEESVIYISRHDQEALADG